MTEIKTHKQYCIDTYGSTNFQTDFSEEIWASTYKDSKDKTIDDTIYRVASAVASVEKTDEQKKHWTEQFYDLLTDFKFTAGGRIFSNAGTDWVGTTLLNCFTAVKPTYDLDSLDGIMSALRNQAQTLKSEGGWGMNFSFIRPRGGFIHGIGVETPGAVTYMEIFNKSSDIITQGSGRKSKNKTAKGKIRKGAMMGILDSTHPDVEEFITAKLSEGRLDKFNISVNCSDEFVEKVIKVKALKAESLDFEEEDKWNLEFPDTTHEMYKQEWNGDLKYWKSLGYPVVVHKTVSATGLWDQIMKSTYARNDPGVLFLDRANHTYCYNYGGKDWIIRETNPCGEQAMPPDSVCLLGSHNLTQYIDLTTNKIDLDKLEKYTSIATRFLDNINDLTKAPLPEYMKTVKEKRRIGLGVMGWGSSLYMLKTKYASKEAEKIKHDLMKTITHTVVKTSIELAKEKGMFVGCEPQKHADHIFWKQIGLSDELLSEIRKYGVRNSSLFSIQPTGNTSIMANITSGGLEPVFMPEYIRTIIVPNCPEELLNDVPKYWAGEFHETDVFKLSKEGNDQILVGEVNGVKYKIDRNRGLTKEQLCSDYGVRYLKEIGEWDETQDWAATTTNLTASEHITDLKGFGKWIDSSISKCVAKGTKIITDKGIFNIEDLAGEEFLSKDSFVAPKENYKVIDEFGNLQKITKVYYGGKKPCVKYKFSNGFEVITTDQHKFKTSNGWLSCVPEKTSIMRVSKSIIDHNDYQKMPELDYFSHNLKKIIIPKVMCEDYAKFIGMWLADGFVNNNSIGIVEKNEIVKKEIERLFNKLFNVSSKISIDKRSGVRTHNLHSRTLAKYFKNIFGHDCVTKKIPFQILNSPHSVKRSFIEGLSLDGYLDGESNLVIYEGYSKDIAVNTSYLLTALGYIYYLGTKFVKFGKKSKMSYSVKFYTNDNLIKTIEPHKNNYKLGSKISGYVDSKDVNNVIDGIPHTIKGSEYRRNFRNSLKTSLFVTRSFLDKIGYNYNNHISDVKVISIEYVGEQEVYDIEVENTHSYNLNGVVCHNTINLPNDYPFEDFENIYLDAWKTGYLKGATTYRAGTMATVLKSTNEESSSVKINKTNAPKRPKELPCDIIHTTVEGQKWVVFVGLLEGEPYEVFGGLAKYVEIPKKHKTGIIKKSKVTANKSVYDLHVGEGEDELIIKNISDTFKDDNNAWATRMISLALRHGSDVTFVVEQLTRDTGASFHSFSKVIGRVLKKYIIDGAKSSENCPECENKLVFQEGCVTCMNCGFTKCA